jgi:hypothetical protein
MRARLPGCYFLLTAIMASAAAQSTAPFSGLNAQEFARLQEGEAVIRSVPDARKLALAATGKTADEIRAQVAAIRPNYLSEVMALVSVADDKAASAVLERLAAAVADVKGYIGIPYWSKRQKTFYDLFDKMDIWSTKPLPGGESIEVVQHMEPFDDYGARYDYRLESSPGIPAAPGKASALTLSATNLGPIVYSYGGYKAVSPGGMLWSLYVYRDSGRILFYGVGAVKAFDGFGLFRERLETSFMGRVEHFFGFMIKKLRSGS